MTEEDALHNYSITLPLSPVGRWLMRRKKRKIVSVKLHYAVAPSAKSPSTFNSKFLGTGIVA